MQPILISLSIPIHFGGYLQYFYFFPSDILKFDVIELVGLLSYFLTFVLFENILFFLFAILICFALPTFLWKKNFPEIIASILLIFFIHDLMFYLAGYYLAYHARTEYIILLGAIVLSSCLFWISRSFFYLKNSDEHAKRIHSLINKLTPLMITYFIFDLIGLTIVFYRNIF